MGITYRRLFSERSALELMAGTATEKANPNYYEVSFPAHYGTNPYEYLEHGLEDVLYIHARYMFLRKIPALDPIPGSFEWYYGAGVMYSNATVTYAYQQKIAPYTRYLDSRKDNTIGPEAIIGFEYVHEKLPLSAHIEIAMVIEVRDRPGILKGLKGFGVRYRF